MSDDEDYRADRVLADDYEIERPDRESYEDPPSAVEGERCCRFCRTRLEDLEAECRHHCRETDEWRREQASRFDAGQTIDPQVHEIGAQLLFEGRDDGMSPFFAIVSQFDRCFQDTFEDENGNTVSRGDAVGRFQAIGETWELNHEEEKVKYWQGKIAMREDDAGDAFYEYNIGIRAVDDVGRKRVNFQFRPALPNAEHVDTGDPIGGLPDDLPEGVRVQVDSANVEREDLVDLLQAFAERLDIAPRYFSRDRIHEWSRVYNYALYVRIMREASSGKIAGKGGLLDRLATFASHEQGRGERKWNNAEIEGHRTAVAMDETNLQRVMPTALSHVGKLLKSYYKINPGEDLPRSDPTTQPKLEVQFSTDYSQNGSVAWDAADEFDAADLDRELDEYLVTALDWAGLPTTATSEVYVADEYWSLEESDRDLAVHPDRLHELRQLEEGLAIQHVLDADGAPTERAVLQEVADGGRMWYEDLAESAGVSLSSLYRAYDTYERVLDREDGYYQIADDVLRSKFQELFATIEDAAEWVEQGAQKLVEGTGVLSQDSALAKWARRYGAKIAERHDRFEIDFSAGVFTKHEIAKVLRSGYQAARSDGFNTALKLREASVAYIDAEKGDRELPSPFTTDSTHVRALGVQAAHLG